MSNLIGVSWTWWLTLGWTNGYDPDTRIFWIGPVGLVFAVA